MWIIMATLWQNVSEKQGLQTGYRLFFRCRQLHLPVDKTHLLRVSETAPQKELSPLERANNIKQALEVKMLPVEWKTVLLIDDIYTTGATVQACTEALQEAGAEQVYVGVICVGEGR